MNNKSFDEKMHFFTLFFMFSLFQIVLFGLFKDDLIFITNEISEQYKNKILKLSNLEYIKDFENKISILFFTTFLSAFVIFNKNKIKEILILTISFILVFVLNISSYLYFLPIFLVAFSIFVCFIYNLLCFINKNLFIQEYEISFVVSLTLITSIIIFSLIRLIISVGKNYILIYSKFKKIRNSDFYILSVVKDK